MQDPKKREALIEHAWGAQRQLPTASHFVIILVRKPIDTRYGSDYTLHIMKDIKKLPDKEIEACKQTYKKFQLNGFDLADDRKLNDWASKQAYIALGNMMTSAALIGIDSCPIEGFDSRKISEVLRNEEMIDDEHFEVSVMVAFGYRDENQRIPDKTRQKFDDIVSWI